MEVSISKRRRSTEERLLKNKEFSPGQSKKNERSNPYNYDAWFKSASIYGTSVVS